MADMIERAPRWFESLEETENEFSNRKPWRQAFLSWLHSGDGVFHIFGTAGSGKSTLMKFLAREEETHQNLQRWAEGSGNRLVFAQFFFWASGDELIPRDPMERAKSMRGPNSASVSRFRVLESCTNTSPGRRSKSNTI